ncbi:hypothetical protein [Leptospira mtsangambouensis]|uniref:hypothetical protein n=1 Tax=Leptospira mtsangambouensis TaxID=2484912 RepID=UPI001EE9E1C8|nr:hypothetical protein [Leptospira mtsangambouensis]MCG6139975.1 hypothetical protein [Leptospira mtsangambouensis]
MVNLFKKNIDFTGNLKSLFPFVFFIHCNYLSMGPDFINGLEANQRISSKVFSKLHSCSLVNYSYNESDTNPDPLRRSLSKETNNSLFLFIHLITRFEVFNHYSHYKTEDIDRCAKDIEFYSCDQFTTRWLNDPNFGIFIASLVCYDVKAYISPIKNIIIRLDELEEKN